MIKFSVWVHPKGYANYDSYYITVEARDADEASQIAYTKIDRFARIGHVRDTTPTPSASDAEAAYWSGDNS